MTRIDNAPTIRGTWLRRAILVPLLVTLSITAASADDQYAFEGKVYGIEWFSRVGFVGGNFFYINDLWMPDGEDSPNAGLQPDSMSGPYTLREEAGYVIARVELPDGPHDIFVFHTGYQLLTYDSEYGDLFGGQECYVHGTPAGLAPMRGTVTATSYLSENLGGVPTRYAPENLTDHDVSTVWVEGADGPGIGERLSMNLGGAGAGTGLDHIVIINGFFWPSNPSLYLDNCRVKILRVIGFDEHGGVLFDERRELQDTPQLQVIEFPPASVNCDELILEIEDVYPGRRFEDTAITGIYIDSWRRYRHIYDLDLDGSCGGGPFEIPDLP
jgi:hypothetical protein